MNQESQEEARGEDTQITNDAVKEETIHESATAVDIERENGLAMVGKQGVNHEKTETPANEKRGNISSQKSEVNQRRYRFVDTGKKSAFFKSQTLNELRPFYNGSMLDQRMAEIRKSIYYIRQHWHEFDTFLTSLKQLMLTDGELTFEKPQVQSYMEKLLTTKRTWLQEFEVAFLDISYDAIKLYTCSEGYGHIYRLSNEIFRREDSIDVAEMIQSVTFLVELINIDLFNYCLKRPEMMHYKGMVYRGMCLCDVDAFKSLRHEPMNRRNIAVPLDEFEVLLRGPFMLVLDIYKDHNLLGGPCHVLEAVMLNANRDHISSAHLGDQDTLARDMFATMAAVTRSEFAVKYCENHALIHDGWEYQKILHDNITKLDILMKDDLQDVPVLQLVVTLLTRPPLNTQ